MAVIGRWNGHRFEINAKKILSWKDLKITSGSEVEEKKSGTSRYAKFKAAKPADVTLTVVLHAMLGVDVRAETEKLLTEARSGAADYFYMGGKKLLPCRLMLTQASVNEHDVLNDQWVRCEVQLSFKQAEKYDDGQTPSSQSSSSGKKKSVAKKQSVKSQPVAVSTAVRYEDQKDAQYRARLQIAKQRAQAKSASLSRKLNSDMGKNTRVVM